MKHLKLDLSKAQEAYKNGDKSIKDFLINAYGKEHFLLDIKDRVTDYESACRELGIEPLTEADFGILPKEDRKVYFNRHQLTIGIRALNEGWKPDFHNHTEYKYYNYVYSDGKSGFSFSVRVRHFYCGSDFFLKSNELAKYAQSIFKQQYLNYLT